MLSRDIGQPGIPRNHKRNRSTSVRFNKQCSLRLKPDIAAISDLRSVCRRVFSVKVSKLSSELQTVLLDGLIT